MAELDYSYIFRCSNKTEGECFSRMLFGENERFSADIIDAKEGDTLFLFNVDKGILMGPFFATSRVTKNIVEEAWDGKFPYQIKVDRKSSFKPLQIDEMKSVITFRSLGSGKQYPLDMKIGIETTKKILKLFESDEREIGELKKSTLEQPKIRTDDGHFVRSKWERQIDNWLYTKKIPHTYEKTLNVHERIMCDFFIEKNTRNENEDVYIELWGKKSQRYLNRREEKLKIYKKYNLNLIELFPEDMGNLDEILTTKLSKYRII